METRQRNNIAKLEECKAFVDSTDTKGANLEDDFFVTWNKTLSSKNCYIGIWLFGLQSPRTNAVSVACWYLNSREGSTHHFVHCAIAKQRQLIAICHSTERIRIIL